MVPSPHVVVEDLPLFCDVAGSQLSPEMRLEQLGLLNIRDLEKWKWSPSSPSWLSSPATPGTAPRPSGSPRRSCSRPRSRPCSQAATSWRRRSQWGPRQWGGRRVTGNLGQERRSNTEKILRYWYDGLLIDRVVVDINTNLIRRGSLTITNGLLQLYTEQDTRAEVVDPLNAGNIWNKLVSC